MFTMEEAKAMGMMAKKSLIDYCVLTQNNYRSNWHHELIAQQLQEVARGVLKRLMIFMPPRHGKSELASIKFPAWYLGRFPNKEIIACSYSAELSEEFGRKARQQVDQELHKFIFPECQLLSGSKSATRWKVSNRGGYRGTGVGGSITGAGADVLIIDDPLKNREEAESPTIRRKIWDWYTSTAFTRLEKGGAVILIMTKWHDDDLAGKILELEGEKGTYYDGKENKWKKQMVGEQYDKVADGKWKVLRFPAIATEKERFRVKGDPLWPAKYDLEALEDKRKTMGPRDWSSLYQQDPVTEEGREFKQEWLQYWETLPKQLNYVTTVDLAISQRSSADDSVVMTTAIDRNDRIYVIEYKNWKADPSEVIEEIYRQNQEYRSRVAVEAVGYQQALMHFLQLEGRKRGKYLHVEQIQTRSNKEAKIRGLIPYYANKLIYHPLNRCQDLEEQLSRFPSGRHDDVIDAFAMAIPLLKRPLMKYTNPIAEIGLKYHADGTPYI